MGDVVTDSLVVVTKIDLLGGEIKIVSEHFLRREKHSVDKA